MFSNFHQVISQSDITTALDLFRQIPVSTISDEHGNTLLHISAGYGNVSITKNLIEQGCDVNATNQSGDTPLNFAIVSGSIQLNQLIKLLLDSGANVHLKNFYGRGPFHFFLYDPKPSVGKMLLEALEASGSKIEEIADLLSSAVWPLKNIIWLNRYQLTQIMIDRGANVNHLDKDGYSVLHDAIIENHPKQIALLLKHGADIHAKTLQGDTPLHIAMLHNTGESHSKIMKILLEHGADVNCVNDYGRTPLLTVLKYCTKRMVNILLENGAKIDCKDEKNKNVLHLAACNTDVSVMSLLLDSGVNFDIDERSSKQLTPLHIATNKGNVEVMKLLLKHNANVNALDETDQSLLHKAIWNYHYNTDLCEDVKFLESIQILLQHGADLDPVIEEGKSILEFANSLKCMDAVQLILKEMAVREIRGIPINNSNYRLIESNEELKNYYDNCKNELMLMKHCKVYEFISMLNILIDSTQVASGYARNEELIHAFEHSNYTMNLNIYHSAVTDRFFQIVKKQRLRKTAAEVLSNILEDIDATHIVIENILNDFSEEEMYQLLIQS